MYVVYPLPLGVGLAACGACGRVLAKAALRRHKATVCARVAAALGERGVAARLRDVKGALGELESVSESTESPEGREPETAGATRARGETRREPRGAAAAAGRPHALGEHAWLHRAHEASAREQPEYDNHDEASGGDGCGGECSDSDV